ncbi:MAG: sensor domain-containing diguanylate cyclase [Gammaproteobacteria bacterium]
MDNINIHHFMAAIPEALLLVDKSGQVRAANECAGQLFGYKVSELIGMVVEQLMPERYRDRHVELRSDLGYEKKFRRLGQGQILYAYHSEGREIPVHISIGVLRANYDGPLFAVTLIDRSEQLKIEVSLKKNSDFYRNIFEQLPLPYQSLDIEGNFLDVNQAWLDFFGYAKNDVIGRFFGDFMRESSLPMLGVTFEKFKQEGYVSSPVFEAKRKGSDERVVITVNGRVERDDSDRFVRTHCILTDVTQRIKAEKELKRRAILDGLTGLFNRDHFYEMANTHIDGSRHDGSPLTLLLLDVDHFKQINDTYGHSAGDTVIRTLANSFSKILREDDVSGRVGGEEFAVLLPKTVHDKGQQIAERLRTTLAQRTISLENKTAIHITVSIGLAHFIQTDTKVDSLMKRADVALYRAKHLGRNRTVNFEQATLTENLIES